MLKDNFITLLETIREAVKEKEPHEIVDIINNEIDSLNDNEEGFESYSRPLIQLLNKEHNPHCRIVITTNSAQIIEGIKAFSTNEFIKD